MVWQTYRKNGWVLLPLSSNLPLCYWTTLHHFPITIEMEIREKIWWQNTFYAELRAHRYKMRKPLLSHLSTFQIEVSYRTMIQPWPYIKLQWFEFWTYSFFIQEYTNIKKKNVAGEKTANSCFYGDQPWPLGLRCTEINLLEHTSNNYFIA